MQVFFLQTKKVSKRLNWQYYRESNAIENNSNIEYNNGNEVFIDNEQEYAKAKIDANN